LAAADGALGSALGRLMAVVEGYPELKADQNLRELSEELTTTENRIGFARQAYNDVVLDYNNKAQQFPEVIVANLFSFKPMEMLQSTESPEERQAVKVQF
jgi:LemA protein